MSINYKIYALYASNKQGDIRYVGYTKGDIEKRLYFHKKSIKYENTHKDNWIKKVLNNEDDVKVLLIECGLTEIQAKKREIEYICDYKKNGYKLTNSTLGGDGLSRPTQETIDKIRKSKTGVSSKLKGKKLEDIVGIEKSIILNKENSKRQQGKILTKEHKEKIQNNSAKFWLGKKISKEHNEKLQNGYKVAVEHNPGLIENRLKATRKPVIQMDRKNNVIHEWNSIQEAANFIEINRSGIGECCAGKRKSAGNFKWKYK